MEDTNRSKIVTLRERLLAFLYRVLNFLHIYTQTQHDQVCASIRSLYEIQIETYKMAVAMRNDNIEILKRRYVEEHALADSKDAKIDECMAEINALAAERNKLEEVVVALQEMNADIPLLKNQVKINEAEIARLNEDIATSEHDRIMAEARIATYKETASVNMEYVKDVQRKLGYALEHGEDFGFPNSRAIPGSATIRDYSVSDEEGKFTVIRTRAIALDHITAEIDRNPDMGTRLGLVLNQMRSGGMFARIGETLLNSGAVQLALAYNPNCTTYELYAEIVARNYAKDAYFVLRDYETDPPPANEHYGQTVTGKMDPTMEYIPVSQIPNADDGKQR